jgi:type IV pilus assembly protein PilY1
MTTRNSPLVRLALYLALCGAGSTALAEDIDIYSGVSSNNLPNVLLVLDSSANWSSSISSVNCYYRENGVPTTEGPRAISPDQEQGKKMAIEKCALYNLIDALPVTDSGNPDDNAIFNIGFMLLNESPDAGAYPRKALTPLTTTSKAAFKTAIKSLSINGDKGSNADFTKALHEAYLYYKGLAPYQGTLGSKWDRAAVSSGRYVSPSTNSCSRNYIIFIANGSPESSENGDALALLTGVGGDTSRLTYPTSVVANSDQANWADEYARFLRNADVSDQPETQGIVTHTVAVTGASNDGLYPNFINAIATQGGGTFHSANNADVLLEALLSIFNDVQAVNSVFAAASLPVSVNGRGTYQNQVFMGMFRPDANAQPRWRGNLKQYQFGLDVLGNLRLVDSVGAPAVSSTTGFISTSATTFWTSSSSFWSNQLMGIPLSASDSPDGAVVEKGAAAQRLRTTFATSQGGRNVYTCVGCTDRTNLGPAATQFSANNSRITDAALGVPNASRDDLIEWVRGTSNAGDERGPTTTPATTIRPSVHGDVLHSRPAVVNYGGSTGVVVFYGANDGMVHAVSGNRSGSGAGEELWSYVPEEMFGKLNRLRANSPLIKLSTTLSPSATPRDYFVDGPIGVYQKLNADLSINRVIIYVGMRRGGRLLYAFDVTDPLNPVYLWRKSQSDLPQLGQTWSEAKVARIRGSSNPVLIFGGGYDAAAEDSLVPGTTTMGHRVYVLDAISGNTLKVFPTTRSVPADVTLVDGDFDGYIDRAYAVDLGGKVYRIDFETANSTSVSDWSIYTVADLSGGTGTGRKFFFAPDAVVTRSLTALMLGSGDREKPLLATTRDHFFQIFDTNTGKGVPEGYLETTWDLLAPASPESTITGRGCYVPLQTGEKVVNAATSIAGATYFGTNRPSAASATLTCAADLGVAKSYAMPLFCVNPSGSELVGGGLPPSPVAGIVNVTRPDNTTELVPFCIGCPNPMRSGIEGSRVNPAIKVPRSRLYWYQETNR